MERSGFNDLLNDISSIDQAGITALEQLQKKYPYFQNLHLLLAMAYKEAGDDKLKPALNKAAIYSVDRAYLKGVLDGSQKFVEVIRTKPLPKIEKKAPPKKVMPTKPVAKPSQPKTKEVSPAPATSEKPAQQKPAPKPVEKPVATKPIAKKVKATKTVSTPKSTVQKDPPVVPPKTQPVPDVHKALDENLKLLNKRRAAMKALLEDKPVKKPSTRGRKSVKKESQSQLIEKFIKNEPKMAKQSLEHDESHNSQEDLAAKKLKKSDEFLTETYAKLLIKQRKYAKAIEIYEKLKLKFPKKTTYFASQIEKLNERGNV